MDPQKIGFGLSSIFMFLGGIQAVLAPYIAEIADALISGGVDTAVVTQYTAIAGAVLAGAGILGRMGQAMVKLYNESQG